MSKEACSVEIF